MLFIYLMIGCTKKIMDSAEVSLNTEYTEKRKHSNNDYGKRRTYPVQ